MVVVVRFGILLLKMHRRYVQDELTSFDGDTDGPFEGEWDGLNDGERVGFGISIRE